MSWKNLKTLAIAILLVMDVFFLYSLIARERAARYYDSELIDAATKIFHESSLYVDKSFLTERIVSLPVYSGTLDEAFFEALLEKMEGNGYTAEKETGGMRFVREDVELYIGNDFTFLYGSGGEYASPSEMLESGSFVRCEPEDFPEILQAARAFLSEYSELHLAAGERFYYTCSFEELFVSGTDGVLCVSQEIGGRDTGNRLYLLYSDGQITAADGRFAIMAPVRKMTAQTVGRMELLFAEKDYLDEKYRQGGEVSRENMILEAVEDSYEVFFDADGSFYFVPVCTLTYRNGETRTYNSVSGEIYS